MCIHLSVSAAETDTKKPSAPPKKAQAVPKAKASEPKEKEAVAPQKRKGDSSKVLATVNGENIIQEDVDHVLGRFGNQISEDQVPAVTQQILDGLITQKLILQFIRDNKLEPSKTEIETEVNKVREDIKANPGLAGQTLEQVLESHGSSIDDLKKDITISLSLEKYLGKDLDDQKIKAYFEQNRSAYDESEVKASHVLVDTRQMKSETELAQAKEKINKIKAEIDAGKDFAEAAKQYSDCPSKEKGGDLGFFKRKGQMVEPFAAAAFALKTGQISGPVQTQFGYHLIKVTEIKKGKDINFDTIKPNVKQDILSEKAKVLIAQLRQNAKIDMKTPL